MDDLRVVRDLLAAGPPSARSTGQAEERLAAAIGAARPAPAEVPRAAATRAGWPKHGLRWRWAVASATVLAGVTAAVLTASMLAPGRVGAPAPTRAPLTAQDILLAAADRADEGGGRYWHVQMARLVGPYRVGAAPHQYNLLGRIEVETWVATRPGDASWYGYRQLGFRPRDEADQNAWRAAGSPSQWDVATDTVIGTQRLTAAPGAPLLQPIDDATTYLPQLGGFTLNQVRQLPTDTAGLRALFVDRIAKNGLARDGWESSMQLFTAMTELLLDVPAPAKVRAAALTVVAGIPGVRAIGHVTDGQGRTGLGIELIHTGGDISEDHRLVFDPTTFLILARDDSFTHDGPSVKEQHSEVLATEWTDQTPRTLTPVP